VSIQILHIDACPNWTQAGDRVREALRSLGMEETQISFRLLSSGAEAKQVPFAGSPTILRDGEDLFPVGDRTDELACRVYVTPTGLAGSPTTEQIIDALRAHA
jgi:hypothetical protein